jgi:hypothetical protein
MSEPHGRIEEAVAKNDRRSRRADARIAIVDGSQDRDTIVRRLELDIRAPDANWAVEERGLGNALIMGHPDAEHGVGRGEVGDQRPDWSTAETIAVSSATSAVTAAIANELTGSGAELAVDIAVGDGDTTADRTKTSLANETDTLTASIYRFSSRELSVVADLRFYEDKPTIEEFQLDLTNGDGAGTASLDSEVSSWSSEVRLTGRLRVEGRDRGPVVVKEGDEKVAKALFDSSHSPTIDKVEIGNGSPSFDRSTTDLTNEIDQRSPGTLTADTSGQETTVQATESWPSSEPNGQPYDITEIGIRLDSGGLLAAAEIASTRLDENASPSFGGIITITPRQV